MFGTDPIIFQNLFCHPSGNSSQVASPTLLTQLQQVLWAFPAYNLGNSEKETSLSLPDRLEQPTTTHHQCLQLFVGK